MLREERESGVIKMEGKLAREVVDFGIDGYFE